MKSVRPTRCIWYISDSAATRTSSGIASWATRMSPSGSPVREYSIIAVWSCSLVTRPLSVSIRASWTRDAALVRGLDLALGGRVDLVDGLGDLVAGVADQLDLAVDALLDHLAGDRVVDIGGRDEHDPVRDGVRHDPEGAADALGQQTAESVATPSVSRTRPWVVVAVVVVVVIRHLLRIRTTDGAAVEPGAVERAGCRASATTT